MSATSRLRLGAIPAAEGFDFTLWAPAAQRALLHLDRDGEPERLPMAGPDPEGCYSVHVPHAHAGQLYRFSVDDDPPLPDPASRYQPQGVHGPSQLVDPRTYEWRDSAWQGIPQERLVFYELHLGTFTPQGTFLAARDRLPHLAELGVTAIELMPLADFAGRWGWGYDPAAFFAPSRAYGTPDDLRALVDAAHELGLAVYLDVIYNHLGPDGAYLPAFSPSVFTDRHHTPWGRALNFDGPDSDGLRRFVIENALMWLGEYHADGLRLDATFAIIDDSPTHILAELAREAARLPGPERLLFAEDHRNLVMLIEPPERGGYGLHGVWSDDFHHQLRRRLTGDNQGYYEPYSGSTEDIAATINGNWFFSGPARGGRPDRGSDASDFPPERFVFALQNHDQIGNRPYGDRLASAVSPAAYRAASALLAFVPQLPLLFMGQEWGACTPFQYFSDHHDELGRLVSEGRRAEFPEFAWDENAPDPQDPDTFQNSKLDWSDLNRPGHARTLRLYRDLLELRRTLSGRARASSPAPGGLIVSRGPVRLLVTLEPDVRLPWDPGAAVEWQSESPAYSAAPHPPRVRGDRLVFTVPAAVIVRLPAETE